jgi:serine/threonine protein phosphatase PrpC
VQYSVVQRSLTGKRSINQDRLACLEREDAVLLVLADGLGGYPGSEHAAQTLVESVSRTFARSTAITDPESFLVLAIAHAHSRINQQARDMGYGEDQAPRTTCVACLVQDGLAFFAHVGDSRLYHLRDGEELDRTVDHSTKADPATRDLLRFGPADPTPGRLWQCVGGPRRPQVTVGDAAVLARDDLLLLCTDGLWHALPAGGPAQALNPGDNALDDALDDLMQRAMASPHYSGDNISAILFRYEDEMTARTVPRRRRARTLDTSRAWDEAKRQHRERRAAKPVTDDDLQRAIDEIETLVRKIDDKL